MFAWGMMSFDISGSFLRIQLTTLRVRAVECSG
jgi:hypothetical protein